MTVWFNGGLYWWQDPNLYSNNKFKKRFNGNNKIEIPSVVSTRDRGDAVLSGDSSFGFRFQAV